MIEGLRRSHNIVLINVSLNLFIDSKILECFSRAFTEDFFMSQNNSFTASSLTKKLMTALFTALIILTSTSSYARGGDGTEPQNVFSQLNKTFYGDSSSPAIGKPRTGRGGDGSDPRRPQPEKGGDGSDPRIR
jgi:hypothetical protein